MHDRNRINEARAVGFDMVVPCVGVAGTERYGAARVAVARIRTQTKNRPPHPPADREGAQWQQFLCHAGVGDVWQDLHSSVHRCSSCINCVGSCHRSVDVQGGSFRDATRSHRGRADFELTRAQRIPDIEIGLTGITRRRPTELLARFSNRCGQLMRPNATVLRA
jgi:hypothetical protein